MFLTVFDYKIKEFHFFCEILLAARVHSQKDPSAELRQARARGAATGLCSQVTSSSPPAPARSCACNTGLNFYQILKLRKSLNPDPPPNTLGIPFQGCRSLAGGLLQPLFHHRRPRYSIFLLTLYSASESFSAPWSGNSHPHPRRGPEATIYLPLLETQSSPL